MGRAVISLALLGGWLTMAAGTASAGAVADQFRGGAFGLPWNAGKGAIEAKYPGGKWGTDNKGRARYCAPSKQVLLKLPAQHMTKELCFLIGSDGTLAAAMAHLDASLPALLAVVNRSRTMFGYFAAVVRDDAAIQSRSTSMLWSKDRPYLVRVSSTNDTDGAPQEVTFAIADEAALYTEGADAVSNKPTSP
jgi:predicted RecA/RadA family phage recombinase